MIAMSPGAFLGNPQESVLLSIIKVFDDLSLGFLKNHSAGSSRIDDPLRPTHLLRPRAICTGLSTSAKKLNIGFKQVTQF